jgi:hypothetical protein
MICLDCLIFRDFRRFLLFRLFSMDVDCMSDRLRRWLYGVVCLSEFCVRGFCRQVVAFLGPKGSGRLFFGD